MVRAGVRLLLLTLLALGIAGMHTLGHPDPGHGAVPGSHAIAMTHISDMSENGVDGIHPMIVCLAVLVGLVLIALGLLGAVRRGSDPHRAPTPGNLRAPPTRPPRPALLTVLRI